MVLGTAAMLSLLQVLQLRAAAAVADAASNIVIAIAIDIGSRLLDGSGRNRAAALPIELRCVLCILYQINAAAFPANCCC